MLRGAMRGIIALGLTRLGMYCLVIGGIALVACAWAIVPPVVHMRRLTLLLRIRAGTVRDGAALP